MKCDAQTRGMLPNHCCVCVPHSTQGCNWCAPENPGVMTRMPHLLAWDTTWVCPSFDTAAGCVGPTLGLVAGKE